MAFSILVKPEDLWVQGLVSIVVLSKAVMQTNLFARHFNNGNHCVSDMKIRTFCPISGSNMIAAKKYEMHHISNVGTVYLLGINKRFSLMLTCMFLSDVTLIGFYFCIFTPFYRVYLCSNPSNPKNTICSNPSDWLLFCHVCFSFNSYKNTRGFPQAPTTNFSTTTLRWKRRTFLFPIFR